MSSVICGVFHDTVTTRLRQIHDRKSDTVSRVHLQTQMTSILQAHRRYHIGVGAGVLPEFEGCSDINTTFEEFFFVDMGGRQLDGRGHVRTEVVFRWTDFSHQACMAMQVRLHF